MVIIKYNKMFEDKYAIYTLTLVVFIYFNAFHLNRCYGNAPMTVRDTLK